MTRSERQVAVIQPYFFPYFGYWQLMAAADVFVVYDDVQYVRQSWMNRNRIVIDGRVSWVTVPVARMSHRTLINQLELAPQYDESAERIRRQVAAGYRQASQLDSALDLLNASFDSGDGLLIETLLRSFSAVRDFLGISTPLVRSSELDYDRSLPKQERLIAVCQSVGGTGHLSLSGARSLYSISDFSAAGLDLRFHDLEHMRSVPELAGQFSVLDTVATRPHGWIVERVQDSRWLSE